MFNKLIKKITIFIIATIFLPITLISCGEKPDPFYGQAKSLGYDKTIEDWKKLTEGHTVKTVELSQNKYIIITDTENVKINAGYFGEYYKVKFYCDETLVSTVENVKYLETVEAPTPLEKEGYFFSGWDDDLIIDEDTNINAIYKSKSNFKSSIKTKPIFAQGLFDYNYSYNSNYFSLPTNEYSKELANLSLMLDANTYDRESVTNAISSIFFEDIVFSNNWDVTKPAGETYAFAHRKIGDTEIVLVLFRSTNYKLEWINNFDLGLTGNHKGFNEAADAIYEKLTNYLETNYNNQKIKLWLTGYSRGGVLSSIICDKLLTNKSFNLTKDDIYCYTFATPKSYLTEGKPSYDNIFNISFEGDVVSSMFPNELGFSRIGNDIFLSVDDLDQKLKMAGIDLKVPKFSKSSDYQNEVQYTKYVISLLLKQGADTEKPSITNREEICNNLLKHVSYLFNLIYSSPSEKEKIFFDELAKFQLANFLTMLGEDGLYNELKEVLDKAGIEYVDQELKDHCTAASDLITNKLADLAPLALTMDNFKKALYLHADELIYAALNYQITN